MHTVGWNNLTWRRSNMNGHFWRAVTNVIRFPRNFSKLLGKDLDKVTWCYGKPEKVVNLRHEISWRQNRKGWFRSINRKKDAYFSRSLPDEPYWIFHLLHYSKVIFFNGSVPSNVFQHLPCQFDFHLRYEMWLICPRHRYESVPFCGPNYDTSAFGLVHFHLECCY